MRSRLNKLFTPLALGCVVSVFTHDSPASLQVGWGGHNQRNNLRAVEDGMRIYDGVEIDVQATKDGVVIGLHDATLDRETNGSGLVSSYRWFEIWGLTYNIGGLLAKLTDLLEVVDAHQGFVILDVRDVPAPLVKAALDEVGFPYHHTKISVFDHDQAHAYIDAIPGAQVFHKFYQQPNELGEDALLQELVDIGYSGVAFPTSSTAFPTALVMDKIRSYGLYTFSFVVTSQQDADRSTALGIDYVIVNGHFNFPSPTPAPPLINAQEMGSDALSFTVTVPRRFRRLIIEEYVADLEALTHSWHPVPNVVPTRLNPEAYQVVIPVAESAKRGLYQVRIIPPRSAEAP